MSPAHRLPERAWMILPLCALGFVLWTDWGRIQRVKNVSALEAEAAVVDATSPTGYAHGQRWLIVPEHNPRSYQWIAETQQMLARQEWRVRRVDSDNAPFGREVHAASPYRWWLGLVAWCDHLRSGRPPGLAVERAALYADPILHWLLLAAATIFVARRFGALPAVTVSLGLAALFPLAAAFLPGVPDSYGLAQACALGSVLLLLDGVRASGDAARRHRFGVAGVAGGLGLWISVANQVPVLGGIVVGAILAAAVGRKQGAALMPWRVWALGGAITSLLAYLLEYYPAHLDLRLQVNHPLYALAWLGAGELLARIAARGQPDRPAWSRRDTLVMLAAVACVAALPATILLGHTPAFLTADPLSFRLTSLANGEVARNFAVWLVRDGLTTSIAATGLPLLLLLPAVWLVVRRTTDAGDRSALALALGPVVATLPFAFQQIRCWGMFDTALLALLVTTAAALAATGGPRLVRRLWLGCAGLAGLAGVIPLVVSRGNGDANAFTRLEVEGLVERDLAHWLSAHAGPGGAVILAPPERSTSLGFYGGLRGLGSTNWENQEGVAATVRIVSANTGDEALALLNQRGVTHLVIPSWDTDLDEFARLSMGHPEDSFIHAVHQWALPPWLRALPYPLPAIAGFEGQSVVILEVTEEANRAVALSRLAEYFVEMHQTDLALAAAQSLQLYPANLGALVAIAEVDRAAQDTAGFDKVFATLLANISSGSDRSLPWDRRVSLAVVLAQGQREDLAREQVRRCLEKVDEARIRSLTTGSLFRLLVLCKAFALPLPDPQLRPLALQLLPAELRERL